MPFIDLRRRDQRGNWIPVAFSNQVVRVFEMLIVSRAYVRVGLESLE